jgi:penicillin-binding protein 1A
MSAIGGSKGSETSLLDMVSAYSVFANQGIFVKATPNKFYVQNENKMQFTKTRPERISTPESSVKTNEMMKLVLSPNGTAPTFKTEAGLENYSEISGKTGSGMVADMWFFTITPKLIVGVWVGLPNNENKLEMEKGFSGGKTAAPIAAKFIKSINIKNSNLFY